MDQYAFLVGQTQTAGLNGPITQSFCIGAPSIYALTANTFAPQCVLIEMDSSTGYKPIAFTNTGTLAVPSWTQNGTAKFVTANASTLTLTAAQSGQTVLLNRAAGVTVTLPAPIVGLVYTFIAAASVTSTAYKIITNAGSVFLAGAIAVVEASGAACIGALGDGSTDVAVSMNGTTTGGLLGTRLTFECISATVWEVSGIDAGSGSIASPFATS